MINLGFKLVCGEVCGGLWCGLWWFVVVCGSLWWFVVVCGGLWCLVPPRMWPKSGLKSPKPF